MKKIVLAGAMILLGVACKDSSADAKAQVTPETPTSSISSAAAPTSVASVQSAADGAKTSIAIRVDDKGFTPSSVTLRKGVPAALVFKRTSDDTCAKEVVFPDLKLKKALPLNQEVAIDVPTDAPRTLGFQCGMGMYKSTVVIN